MSLYVRSINHIVQDTIDISIADLAAFSIGYDSVTVAPVTGPVSYGYIDDYIGNFYPPTPDTDLNQVQNLSQVSYSSTSMNNITWDSIPPATPTETEWKAVLYGNLVTLSWRMAYTLAGTANKKVFFDFPSNLPLPRLWSVTTGNKVYWAGDANFGVDTNTASAYLETTVAGAWIIVTSTVVALNPTEVCGTITYLTDRLYSTTSLTWLEVPSNAVHGVGFSSKVAALGNNKLAASNYNKVITVTSSDMFALLPGPFSTNNGVSAYKSIVLNTAGTQTITATDTGGLTAVATVVVT